MDVKLSKDESNYIKNSASGSYLLLQHEPFGGIDYFNVYNENGNKEYSVDVRGKYRKSGTTSPTLEIFDKNGTVIGSMQWNNEHPSLYPFSVRCVDYNGIIEKQYEEGKRFFRKSWYKPSFSSVILDYHTVLFSNGENCAIINKIENYKKNLRGVKQLRDSYLIDRFYNSANIASDVLVLLYWALIYLCEDYNDNHNNRQPEYISKSKIETKLEEKLQDTKSALNNRKNIVDDRQEELVEEQHNRARAFENDRKEHLEENSESKSKKQRILSIVIKVLICIVVPIVGLFVAAYINTNTTIRINVEIVAIVFFLGAVLIVNRNNPEWVMFYEWLKLVLFCILGLIASMYLEVIIERLLGSAGIKGIDVGIPLILAVIVGICKWRSRHIDQLVYARPVFSIIQFASLGLLLGQICMRYVDSTGRWPIFCGVVAIAAVIALSRVRIIARKSVRNSIISIASGVLLSCIMELVIKIVSAQ